MASSEWLGRWRRPLAALGIAISGFLTGCTFNLAESRSFSGDLYRTYQQSMENRAQRRLQEHDSAINQIRNSREDPFIYDALVRDGLPGMLGDDAEQKNIERAKDEAIGVIRRAAGDTLKDAFRQNIGGVDYIIPDFEGEEKQSVEGAYGPEAMPLPDLRTNSRSKGKVRTKVVPGLHRVAYGVRAGPLEIKGAKRYEERGNTLETDVKFDDFLINDLYFSGGWDRDFDKDTHKFKFAAQYGAFSAAANYNVDKREPRENRRDTQFLLQYLARF